MPLNPCEFVIRAVIVISHIHCLPLTIAREVACVTPCIGYSKLIFCFTSTASHFLAKMIYKYKLVGVANT